MKKCKYVVGIGGANIDIQGFSFDKLIMEDSNPGAVKISSGGVGRNIAENLTKLGISVKFMTVFGDDAFSQNLKQECTDKGIDVSHSLAKTGIPSSIYLSILDNNGDMKLALCNGDALADIMTVDYIESKHDLIENASIIVVDTNLPEKILRFVADTFGHKPIFVDTVSTQKSSKIKNFIGCFDTIKLNKLEAESLSGIKSGTPDELSLHFAERGIKNVFITLGDKGVHYRCLNLSATIPSPKVEVINATGAGDAFMAALVYSRLNSFNPEYTARFSMTAAILALSHENTINPNMSLDNIKIKMKELELCWKNI